MARFLKELRRRQVYQTVALYALGAWGTLQVADTLFPAWNIPESAKQFLVIGAMLGAPFALFFGWRYDITPKGIRRTPPGTAGDQPLPLTRADSPALGVLAAATVAIIYWMVAGILNQADNQPETSTSAFRQGSIAVLPFSNISSDPENEYFCDGISEELLLKLGEYRDLHVLGRASSFAFKDSELTTSQISDLLGVQYLLDGSVRKQDNQVRIAARLVDNTGFQVWEQSFDRELTSIFEIQAEIATAVAQSLASIVSGAPVGYRDYQPDIDAYQDFLLGRELLRSRAVGWIERSAESFANAIERDPGYAAPYAGLAISRIFGATGMRRKDTLDEAQTMIDRALELNPDLPEAHAAQGLLGISRRPPDNERAEASLRRAMALDPSTAGAANWLAIALRNMGRHEESQAIRLAALERDPLDVILIVNAGLSSRASGDFAGAERQFRRLLDIPGAELQAYGNLAGLYQDYGKYERMIEARKRSVLHRAETMGTVTLNSLAQGYMVLGMWPEADTWQQVDEAMNPDNLSTVFARLYELRMQGRRDGMSELMDSIIDEYELDHEQLPFWAAQVMGAAWITAGELERGIEILEQTFDLSQPMISTLGGGAFGISVLNTLVWAYQATGQDDKADETLAYVLDQIESWQAAGASGSPSARARYATALVLSRRVDEGLTELEQAIDIGYRDYYFTWHDLPWAGLREDRRFLDLMERIKTDVDVMVERIREVEAGEDFGGELERALERGRHPG